VAGVLALASISAALSSTQPYDYINWYMSGWVGAFLNRPGLLLGGARDGQGQHDARRVGFWMEGKPGERHHEPQGKLMEKAGTVARGGSFYDARAAVSVRNAVDGRRRYMGSEVEFVHRRVPLT